MGMRANEGIDRVSAKLPEIYGLLLELEHEEPDLARQLLQKLKRTVDFYRDLLQRLEDKMDGHGRVSSSGRKLQVEARRIELEINQVQDEVAHSRKRSWLRRNAILELLADGAPKSGRDIAKHLMQQRLADNIPSVVTHISRLRNDGLVRSMASGVVAITEVGRSELKTVVNQVNGHNFRPRPLNN
jgi:hypothetical protein